MTTREKHIEYSSNVVRNLSPSLSPREADFDNKIDYLLEDLQQSVSRPGSSLGHNSHSNFSTLSNSNRDRDVQYFSTPTSQAKVIRERSVSPTSGRRTYKTSKYEYSTSSSGGGVGADLLNSSESSRGRIASQNTSGSKQINVETSINQLDSLLGELKTERDLAHEQNISPITNTGIDSGLLEPGHNSRIVQSSFTSKSTKSSSELKPVQRELKFDSAANVSSETTRSREYSPGYQKVVSTTNTKNINYDPYVPEKLENDVLNTISRSVNRTAEALKPVHETVTVDTIQDPLQLEGLPLESNILPAPGTKVTTTVRTYTYEIPAERAVSNHQTVVYNTKSSTSNTARNTLDRNRPERDIPSDTIIYRNESYNNATHYLPDGSYPGEDRPVSPRPINKNVTYIHDSYNNTTHNTMDYPETDRPFPVPPVAESPVNKTVVYKRNTRETTTNYPGGPNRPTSPVNYPDSPPNTTIVYKEDITNNTNNVIHPGGPNYPPPSGHNPNGGPTTTYYYKHESSNTTNRRYGPPGSANGPPAPAILPPADTGFPPRDPPGTVSYKYSTHTTTKNVSHGGPDETDSLLKPAPFPTTGQHHPYIENGTPKRLDDLLSKFDETPQKKSYHQQNLMPDKPYTTTVDSLVETANADQKVPTRNVAGPPVYYPPGEMFTKRSEEGAAWQAQGGYARGSGKYMYEADGKSKSKSSSGAAMVPVCLPLCCAMPCSIM